MKIKEGKNRHKYFFPLVMGHVMVYLRYCCHSQKKYKWKTLDVSFVSLFEEDHVSLF